MYNPLTKKQLFNIQYERNYDYNIIFNEFHLFTKLRSYIPPNSIIEYRSPSRHNSRQFFPSVTFKKDFEIYNNTNNFPLKDMNSSREFNDQNVNLISLKVPLNMSTLNNNKTTHVIIDSNKSRKFDYQLLERNDKRKFNEQYYKNDKRRNEYNEFPTSSSDNEYIANIKNSIVNDYISKQIEKHKRKWSVYY
jgi:hypothetical protein